MVQDVDVVLANFVNELFRLHASTQVHHSIVVLTTVGIEGPLSPQACSTRELLCIRCDTFEEVSDCFHFLNTELDCFTNIWLPALCLSESWL